MTSDLSSSLEVLDDDALCKSTYTLLYFQVPTSVRVGRNTQPTIPNAFSWEPGTILPVPSEAENANAVGFVDVSVSRATTGKAISARVFLSSFIWRFYGGSLKQTSCARGHSRPGSMYRET